MKSYNYFDSPSILSKVKTKIQVAKTRFPSSKLENKRETLRGKLLSSETGCISVQFGRNVHLNVFCIIDLKACSYLSQEIIILNVFIIS